MGYSQNWKKDRKTGEFRRQTKKLHTNCNMKQKLKAVTGKYQRWRETADWTVGEEGGEGPKFPELFVQHIFKCTREAKATSPLPKILPSNQRGPYITHISAFFL